MMSLGLTSELETRYGPGTESMWMQGVRKWEKTTDPFPSQPSQVVSNTVPRTKTADVTANQEADAAFPKSPSEQSWWETEALMFTNMPFLG